ncbi:hypothetical protein ACFQH2_02300 [Natronoarchaeum sp. GCM10025703]|uniref:hypothetical protein n=1 Tax=unclassified Natronoarchaeum TaxID=2620183 RepID=UPI0036213865
MGGTAPSRDVNLSVPTRTVLIPILIALFSFIAFIISSVTNTDISSLLTIAGAIMNGIGAMLLVTPNMPKGFPRDYLQRLVPEAQQIDSAREWFDGGSVTRDSAVLEGFRYCHELAYGEIDGELERVSSTSTGYQIEIKNNGKVGTPNTRSGAVKKLVMARLFDDGLHRAYTYSGVVWIALGVFVSILSI